MSAHSQNLHGAWPSWASIFLPPFLYPSLSSCEVFLTALWPSSPISLSCDFSGFWRKHILTKHLLPLPDWVEEKFFFSSCANYSSLFKAINTEFSLLCTCCFIDEDIDQLIPPESGYRSCAILWALCLCIHFSLSGPMAMILSEWTLWG